MNVTRLPRLLTMLIALGAIVSGSAADELPLPVADIKREDAIDFNEEIMPILRRKCVACHHSKEAESGLVLETYSKVMEGGDSGEGIVAGDAESSLVFTRATGIEEPLMPPEDNGVGAEPLTPQELGLLKAWILKGANGEDASASESMQWQPLPPSVRSIYALDVSPDGRFAVHGRGNRAQVIDLLDPEQTQTLADPSLGDAEIADMGMIQSAAFSEDGNLIATGGFRTVRLWRRSYPDVSPTSNPLAAATGPVAIAPNADLAALVNAIGDVEIWDLNAFQRTHTLPAGEHRLTRLAWPTAADRLVTGDAAGHLRLWQPSSGSQLTHIATGTTIDSLSVSPDATWIVTTTGLGTVGVYRCSPQTEEANPTIETVAHPFAEIADATDAVALSAPQPAVIVASESQGVVLLDPGTGQVVRKFDHGSPVSALAVSRDQTTLATGGRDGRTQLWNITDGSPGVSIRGTRELLLRADATEGDVQRQTQMLADLNSKTAGIEQLVKTENEALAKVQTARDEAAKALEEKNQAAEAARTVVAATEMKIEQAQSQATEAKETISNVATQIAQTAKRQQEVTEAIAGLTEQRASADQAVTQLEQQLAELQKQLDAARNTAQQVAQQLADRQSSRDQLAQKAEMAKAELETAKQSLASADATAEAARKEREAQQAEATKAAEAAQAGQSELEKRDQALAAATDARDRAAAVVPAHQQIITTASRRLDDLKRNQTRVNAQLEDPSRAVVGIGFAPETNRVATIHRDGSLQVASTTTGKPLHDFDFPEATEPAGVSWVGSRLCGWQSTGPAKVVEPRVQWELVRTIGGVQEDLISDRVTALAFHRDHMTLAVGSGQPSRNGEIKIFAVHNGQLLRNLDQAHSDVVLSLAFSPDGGTLASGAADKTVRLIDMVSGEILRTLEGHTHHVLAVDWQRDGRQLASASADRTVKVWDVATGTAARTIGGFPEELSSIEFLAKGSQLVTTSINGQARLANASDGKTVRNFNTDGDFLFAVATTPDGQFVLAGGHSGTLRMWNTEDGSLVHQWD